MNLSTVATDSNQKVDGELEKYSQARHQLTGPIELTPRDNTPPPGECPVAGTTISRAPAS